MKKVCVIGHFGGNKICLDGQTVKTKIITAELKKQLGENRVSTFDTYGGKKTLIKCFFKVFSVLKGSENVIMLPAHNGVRFFTPVLLFCNRIYRRKLHYSVIGGWLPEMLNKRPSLAKQLKKFDHIYVETISMKKALEAMGFENISIVPNCKELNILSQEELPDFCGEPYKLCTFSRVCKEKGIEDAVNAVKQVNESLGRTVYALDIYGQVDKNQEQWFAQLQAGFPEYVKYGGLVDFDKSVEVIKDYFALLFPTHYATEGFPGTVIDAYAAGVPIIAYRWQNAGEFIDEGSTGYIVEAQNISELAGKLTEIAKANENWIHIKKNCLKRAEGYLPKKVMKHIISNF